MSKMTKKSSTKKKLKQQETRKTLKLGISIRRKARKILKNIRDEYEKDLENLEMERTFRNVFWAFLLVTLLIYTYIFFGSWYFFYKHVTMMLKYKTFYIESLFRFGWIIISGLIIFACHKMLCVVHEKFSNNFVFLSIFLVVAMIFFGQAAVEEIYPNNFNFLNYPIKVELNNTLLEISCEGPVGQQRPTIYNFVKCNVSMENYNEERVKINELVINRANLANGTYEEYSYYCYISVDKNEKDSCITTISLGSIEGTYSYQLRAPIKYQNGTVLKTHYTHYSLYDLIAKEDYDSWITQKYSLLLTIMVGSVLSTFVGVKNLMNIWDRKRNSH